MDPSGRISRIVGVPRLIDPPIGATQSVSVEVVRVLGPGRFLINYGGRSATAFSSLDLQPGQVLKAHLSQDADGLSIRVPLHPQGDSLSSILRELALPDDALSRRVVEALLRSGLGLNPDRIAYLRNLFKSYADSGRLRGLTRIAALLEDKGLDPSLSEALFEPVYGSADGDESEAGGDPEHGGDDQFDLRGAPEGPTRPADHDELVEHISHQLRALLAPSADAHEHEKPDERRQAEKPEAELLRLFNQVPGKIAHWVVVPFRLRRNDETVGIEQVSQRATSETFSKELNGRIRVRLDPTRLAARHSRSGAELVVLDVEGSKGRWWCEIRPDGHDNSFRVVVRTSSREVAVDSQASLEAFRERFAAAGITIDMRLQASEFDGFSSEATADIIHDIDMKA
ncbi:MAG: hypothetical protein EA428_03165 [Spirochaetaceae bacterium]|nr:MAG: hypothetical protein EA428_03165 [Spirochaetaceae bacterium]